jgi:uncharacterized protein (TIGR03437 family)
MKYWVNNVIFGGAWNHAPQGRIEYSNPPHTMKRFKQFGESRTARFVALALASYVFASTAGAQQNRITKPVNDRERIILSGHIRRKARPENDAGRVSPSLKLPYVTLTLAQSESQQAELDKLLSEQQTPGSPNYHHWLTPDEYAQRFGAGKDDLNKIAQWLRSQGLAVASIARGRNWIAVSGSAAQIEAAFQTEIHEYVSDGETHFANATEPSVPVAFGDVVSAIRGLNDFRPKPQLRERPNQESSNSLKPAFTSSKGNHFLAPNDLATIYNIAPLYAAGFNGAGQALVIAGQTQINLSDIQQFRATYNLPAIDPQIMLVPNAKDPGIRSGDMSEADLDIEWSGAVARNAAIIFVYADDVMQAVQYAIDQRLAPVVSTSYGLCELETSNADARAMQSWAKQGNAQGITWFSASGDNGGADCGDAQNAGLSVDIPASIPEVTGVGGTEFQEGTGQYWNAASDASGASVQSYIPETSWNDSAIDGSPSASGGGASVFFSRPSWQSGVGVPADNARHVPDVSLTASAQHDGYLVYTGGNTKVFGGTSVPTPAFAGIAALLNHYLVSTGQQTTAGVGNVNPRLYSLAQSAPDAFHDITTGDNIVTVTCPPRARTCSTSAVGNSAGAGYDAVTGLGSVDTYKLVTKWNGGTTTLLPAGPSITLLSNLNVVSPADTVFLIATANAANGSTPSGLVEFAAGGAPLGSTALVGSAGTATATLAVSGALLPAGSRTITAAFRDNSGNSVTASVTVSVSATRSISNQTPSISAVANGASFRQVFAPGMILSVFGSQLAPSTSIAGNTPLPNSMAGVAVTINGVAAPLYYVSPSQLNIQIPYETAAGAPAIISINNNGQITSQSFQLASAAPGIFIDQSGAVVPNGPAVRGQIITVYVTGTGMLSPAISTGGAPPSTTAIADLPKPVQKVDVTVAGISAPIQFVGNSFGLVGVTQINFQVPADAPIGRQPVVVTIGGVPSVSASQIITN